MPSDAKYGERLFLNMDNVISVTLDYASGGSMACYPRDLYGGYDPSAAAEVLRLVGEWESQYRECDSSPDTTGADWDRYTDTFNALLAAARKMKGAK